MKLRWNKLIMAHRSLPRRASLTWRQLNGARRLHRLSIHKSPIIRKWLITLKLGSEAKSESRLKTRNLTVLPVPDGDVIRIIGRNEPWVRGMHLYLHDLIVGLPKRSRAQHFWSTKQTQKKNWVTRIPQQESWATHSKFRSESIGSTNHWTKLR